MDGSSGLSNSALEQCKLTSSALIQCKLTSSTLIQYKLSYSALLGCMPPAWTLRALYWCKQRPSTKYPACSKNLPQAGVTKGVFAC
eukprot:1138747-Pelagomonas_calceolata.AAC.6